MPTTITETQVPSLKIHVLESEEQFENLIDIDDDALYLTPFTVTTYAEDDEVVHINEPNETIQGLKIFTNGAKMPMPNQNPTNYESNVATTQYVDVYGGKVDGVTVTVNGVDHDATIQDRNAEIDISLDFAPIEEPIFEGTRPPLYDAGGNNPVRLATINDVGVTDVQINSDSALVTVNNGLADLDLTDYVELIPEQSPAPAAVVSITNAQQLDGHYSSYYATAASITNVIREGDTRLTNPRTPVDHAHSLTELYLDKDASPRQALSTYLSTNFSASNHTHSTLTSSNNFTVSLPAISANDTLVLESNFMGAKPQGSTPTTRISYGTESMTVGTTTLPTGYIYFQYE